MLFLSLLETDGVTERAMKGKLVPLFCYLGYKQVLHNKSHPFLSQVVHRKAPVFSYRHLLSVKPRVSNSEATTKQRSTLYDDDELRMVCAHRAHRYPIAYGVS